VSSPFAHSSSVPAGVTHRALSEGHCADCPVIGFLAFTSGSYEGAIIRDMRLANSLRLRGYRVVVYWMMEVHPELVDPGIVQRTLCSGLRYHFARPLWVMDMLGQLSRVVPAIDRREFLQERPQFVARLLRNCVRAMCDGDPGLARRLATFVARDRVTHLLPSFAMICPLAEAMKRRGRDGFDFLVTFQGEEIFANYAAAIGRLGDFHGMLRAAVAASGWPAIAVSRDYALRLHEEMGIDPDRLTSQPPGILPPDHDSPKDRVSATATLRESFPNLAANVPIVSYFGRQDAEKGIDLLLYAARILRDRGARFQLVCVGPSSFGNDYALACKTIANHLRLPVIWGEGVSETTRSALYRASRCVVCPSIHREPFGMVAAEAMSHGTPAIVPDRGGIAEIISEGDRHGGLAFAAWDSGDLADQIERLLADDVLHAELCANAPVLAGRYSVERLTDAVIAHLGLRSTAVTAKERR
jgi:glycosyltransferase involved in cell wall biosynthesis